MSKPINSIKLNKKEDAIIYYEKTLGESITTRKRATVIFYVSKGEYTITEIHRKSGCTQVFVRSTIKGYLEKGIYCPLFQFIHFDASRHSKLKASKVSREEAKVV